MLNHIITGFAVSVMVVTVGVMGWMAFDNPNEVTLLPETYEDVEKISTHLDMAVESFENNVEVAAKEIRNAVDLMEKELEQASDQGKALLSDSISELTSLSNSIEQGAVTSIDEVEAAVARAYHALGTNEYYVAVRSWSEQRIEDTAMALDKARSYFEELSVNAGERIEPVLVSLSENLREISGTLVETSGLATSEIGHFIENAGEQIQQLGQEILPEDQ